jgi:hypothetical protein
LKEEHDCKNLIPIGAKQSFFDAAKSKEKAMTAFGRFKAWGASQKPVTVARVLPKKSISEHRKAVAQLKRIAKGDTKVPLEKRLYLFVEAEKATTTSKLLNPKGEFFVSKDWVIGRVLDSVAKSLQVENVNNHGLNEEDRLRVFHIEKGRLLEFNEKAGTALTDGDTVVLLRGIGPAVPDLIEA